MWGCFSKASRSLPGEVFPFVLDFDVPGLGLIPAQTMSTSSFLRPSTSRDHAVAVLDTVAQADSPHLTLQTTLIAGPGDHGHGGLA